MSEARTLAEQLKQRAEEQSLTEHDRLIMYRGALILTTQELVKIAGNHPGITDLGLLSYLQQLFILLDPYDTQPGAGEWPDADEPDLEKLTDS